jgi:hypothetical protein
MATAPPAWIEELAASIGAACGPEAADASRDAMLAMTEEEARAYANDQIAACTDAGTGGGKPQKPPKGDKPGKGNGRGGG